MCGIAGYFVSNSTRVRPQSLQRIARRLLLNIESRGRDATGFAYVSVKDKAVYLAKAPINATQFLNIDGHILNKPQIRAMPRMMLLHTRAATQGLPSNNLNNHPLYSKASNLCLVHNGWISNDDRLIDQFQLSHDAEVDTEIYLRLIEHFYLNEKSTVETSVQQATSKVFGSLACAMIQGGKNNVMWVWRDSGALSIARMDWGWVFASTANAVLSAAIGGSTAFDGSVEELITPPASTLYTLSMEHGLQEMSGIHGADWRALPADLEGRVTRTYVNGELTSVRRLRPTRANSNTSYWSDDDWEGYGEGWTDYTANRDGYDAHTQSYSQPSQSRLPGVVDHRTRSSYYSTSRGTNYSWKETEPQLPWPERAAWIARADKAGRSEDCRCRLDYVCLSCRPFKYCGIVVKEPEKTAIVAGSTILEASEVKAEEKGTEPTTH